MRGYGRGGRGGYSADHTVEKTDGKKNAIAETIAMMNKMKMEDKERKEEGEKRRLARLQREGIETGEGAPQPPPQSDPEPETEMDPERMREESRKNRQLQQRGRGEGRERRGHGRGGLGAVGGMGMDTLPGAYNHQFQAGGGMGPANLMQQQVCELITSEGCCDIIIPISDMYRVTHLLANLGWVDFDLGCSTILFGQ